LVFAAVGGSSTALVGALAPGWGPAQGRDAPQAEAPAESVGESVAESVAESEVGKLGAPVVGWRPPAPSRTVEPTRFNGRVQPVAVNVPAAASGRYDVVPGEAQAPSRGPVVRYLVEMERGLPFDAREFADDVHRILNHEHGWGRDGRTRFQRVDAGAVLFRVSLSSPALTDQECAPLRTFGRVSCFSGGRAVINALRWGTGSPTYGKDIASYREYLISHEVGHGLGHGHVTCPALGALAPVMVQQTKSLQGCRANPWPYP